jgi:anti-sigma-K factor RskA
VAQTKRRRQTKHRGNAAGVVTSRGRTGRKPTAAEKAGTGKDATDSHQRRTERLNRPPTWRSAFVRALIAAVLVLVASLFVLPHQNQTQAFIFFPIVLIFYVPVSYYTDMWMWRRRMRKQAEGPPRDRVRS